MKKDSSTECWNKYADDWIQGAQKDIMRIHFIMPFTFKQLGDISGKVILDIGCGEGGYSREFARKGAIVTAVDCAENSIEYSKSKAEEEQLNITHYVRNSCDLYGIADNTFDIVLSSMMLMDCEDFEGTVKEITRVLKPSGKLFASVLHPCFAGTTSDGISRQGEPRGLNRQVVVWNYYHPKKWVGAITKEGTQIIWHHRTIEDYVKMFIKCSLTITDLHEPVPTDEQAAIKEDIAWLQKIPVFMFWELKK
jgi:2-polyprenyl-3-methyl-5-hydroxy-6-metoxy-1,4-benzoquinol methylase